MLARNVRVGRDEIDLLVRLDGEVAAVEVKTGRVGPVDPLESFTPEKEARVRRAAAALRPPVHRVDLVTVSLGVAGVTFRWVPRV